MVKTNCHELRMKFLNNPWKLFSFMAGKCGYFKWMPDELYLRGMFRAFFPGKKLNLKNPQTFNEKLQWLKLHDRRPEYTMMVDKYKVREYIAEKLGEEYLIPLIGVWDDPDDIDFDALPDQFVLKCNHNSGLGMCICKDKSKLDISKVKAELRKGIKQDYYLTGREWPYKNVPRKIICEKYMSDGSDHAIVDYKFYCFYGKADVVLLCTERDTGTTKFYFFDRDWNLKRYNGWGKKAPEGFTLPKPEGMDEMFDLAEKLSAGIPFVRMDFYNIDGHIYFGEFTFYPQSGFDTGRLPETDLYFGNLLNLDVVKKF